MWDFSSYGREHATEVILSGMKTRVLAAANLSSNIERSMLGKRAWEQELHERDHDKDGKQDNSEQVLHHLSKLHIQNEHGTGSIATHIVMLLRALKARRWRRGSTTREVDGSYGEPETTRGSLVLRWTSKLGCCLTRQSKRSCSEAVKEKAICHRQDRSLA